MRYESESPAKAAADAERLHTGRYSNMHADEGPDGNWALGVQFPAALELARHGWRDQLDATLEVAESAVQMADKEHMMDSFNEPVWDVTGATVDVGAFLAGTPECMIDYPLSQTSKVGRIVTLVANCSASASIGADTILRRGQLIVALAMALGRLGHAVEMWAVNHTAHKGGGRCELNVKVKGVDDELDPAAVMFAYAHPAMLRRIVFGIREKKCDVYQHRPAATSESRFPEGTIFLPELLSHHDVPDADVFLRKYLGELGLLAE